MMPLRTFLARGLGPIGRLLVPITVVALLVTGGTVVALETQAHSSQSSSTSAAPVSLASSDSSTVPRQFGVATPSNGWNQSEIQAAAASAGHDPSIVLHYLGFTDELHREQLQNVAELGAMSMMTWEPWDYRVGTTSQPQFALRRIIEGDFDDYILRTARTLRDFERPVLVSFAHEMNGDWYPWSEQTNGNRSGEYVAAYRHVHGLVASAGAHNVSWLWSPNVEYPGSQSLAGLYPGGDYVDVIAVNGYNFGTSQAWSSWQNPSELFGSTLSTVRSLAPGKPLMIGETSSSEVGGNKAIWISDLFAWLDTQSDVQAVVWFNLNKETDWRIDSSAASAEAFPPSLSSWLSATADPAEPDPGDGGGGNGDDGAVIASVTAIGYSTSGGKNQDRHLTVAVSLTAGGAAVSGANVTINLYRNNILYSSETSTTTSAGTASFTARNAPSGTYTIKVIAVNGVNWDGETPINTFTK